MKRFILLIAICLFIPTNIAKADCSTCVGKVQTESQCCEVLDTLRKERQTMYNALNLTPEQVQCLMAIEKRTAFDLDSLFLRLCIAHGGLEQLKCEKADRIAIKTQKEEVKSIENEIDKIMDSCDREFEACLSCDQRAKYHMLKKLERNDLKHLVKTRKPNPDVRVFGVRPEPKYIKPCRKGTFFNRKSK